MSMHPALSVPKVTVAAYPAQQQLGDLDLALEDLPLLTVKVVLSRLCHPHRTICL